MGEYFQDFCKLMGTKNNPSQYEKDLFVRTQKYCRYISWIPGLKMVAICNSLSMYATKSPTLSSGAQGNGAERSINGKNTAGSDIDLFIIAHPKRLWIVRLTVTVIFQLLGVRRHGDKTKERFCLSFFITENAMDFSKIAIQNDIYLYYWIYYLKPIINKDSNYEKFIKANAPLGINELNLNGDNKAYIIKTPQYNKWFDKCRILDFKDYLLKKIFLPKTLRHKKRLGSPFGLIVSDDILKFTDNDRRVEIRDILVKN